LEIRSPAVRLLYRGTVDLEAASMRAVERVDARCLGAGPIISSRFLARNENVGI